MIWTMIAFQFRELSSIDSYNLQCDYSDRNIPCVLCHPGEQQQPVRCFELEVGVVDESLCDPESRPEDRHRKCKNMDCPVRFHRVPITKTTTL